MNPTKIFTEALLIITASPLLFLNWLFVDKNFSHGKAVLSVIFMFLFGSLFFY
jgi:hypothetical protein